ncbi:hypothetical protein OBBRIDRAFT_134581 [Obba rivulosa]|uniref:Uncharacterized protein n=1 Tax=Obba rivulosa TaxID=1052685 RepID=A0A8E2AYH1_9APHY|nr:hypothetical protein OBBRIDRAFT_134581 [Obba rivulosa]
MIVATLGGTGPARRVGMFLFIAAATISRELTDTGVRPLLHLIGLLDKLNKLSVLNGRKLRPMAKRKKSWYINRVSLWYSQSPLRAHKPRDV